MLRFLARRLALAVPTLILASMIIFALQQLLPGDVATALTGEERDPQVIAFI
ncbi:MAG: ABC transporter permease, partial [Methylobacterium organophilum]|nr:ABC transporter permease [Methylobacterium organophilum]